MFLAHHHHESSLRRAACERLFFRGSGTRCKGRRTLGNVLVQQCLLLFADKKRSKSLRINKSDEKRKGEQQEDEEWREKMLLCEFLFKLN